MLVLHYNQNYMQNSFNRGILMEHIVDVDGEEAIVIPLQSQDVGIVVGMRMCSSHGPEILLQSLNSPMMYLVELEMQLRLTRDPHHETVRHGCIYDILPVMRDGVVFEIAKRHDDPRNIAREKDEGFVVQDRFHQLPILERESWGDA